jgi:hypothetical protein
MQPIAWLPACAPQIGDKRPGRPFFEFGRGFIPATFDPIINIKIKPTRKSRSKLDPFIKIE